MARFLIVDDHPLFREALTSALRLVDAEADIYEATSIEGALDVLDAHDDFELALLELVVQRYRDAGLTDITTDYHQDARHEVFNETNRDEITANLLAWLSRFSA